VTHLIQRPGELLVIALTLAVSIPAIAILWCTVPAAAIVRAILAFTILAGHGWSYVKSLLVDY